MSDIKPVDYESFKKQIPLFKEKSEEFYNKTMNMKDYKSFSGKYGSYAQRGGKKNMLRLRMTAGKVTPDKLHFVADMADKYAIEPIHFTTCQTIQLHNLDLDAVVDIMDKALDHKIVWYGGGGDYPRNVMCSPLSGVEEEYFDVMPYAETAANFLLDFIDKEKMPRKLKVGFSNNQKNEPHATFRDLGFVARPDGKFDVYCAGGLGRDPKLGVLVAEDVDPNEILYYIEAMILLFRAYGNYENRAKARTRYMQDVLGADGLRKEFAKYLTQVKESRDLTLTDVEIPEITKKGEGEPLEESFIVHKQKQPGLYALLYHPRGGIVTKETVRALSDAIDGMEDVEVRLKPDEGSYIINLTADEARKILAIIEADAAKNEFETSEGCIGATICQVGLRDSQGALKAVLEAVKEAGDIADNALPQIHISGCTSSCAAHQIAPIGFRGNLKVVDKKPVPAFSMFVEGEDIQGNEKLGQEVGIIAEKDLPAFLVKLGRDITKSGLSFEEWQSANPNGLVEEAQEFFL
ncbi:nitrite/sulfite reductase [Allobaculum sp. JKK-2023]|uniref:nitrite/sulfite reductase n=1 Tax=Allobaculum sp. JKK-2023 TaxID=3108943 RepID=UPI002B06225C|nr:nitrite/sulfite reductase [Allobaculum sp. JKK-2023]